MPVAVVQPALDATVSSGRVSEFPLSTKPALAAVTVNGAEKVNVDESVLPPEKPPRPAMWNTGSRNGLAKLKVTVAVALALVGVKTTEYAGLPETVAFA